MSPPPDRTSTPDTLFAAHLARERAGEASDFEALCRAHPEHAAALRELHATWKRALDIELSTKTSAAKEGSFAARLKDKYGAGVDPGISLDSAPDANAPATPSNAPTDALVSRLAQHTLAQSRYKLEGEVARGGMGAILRVWDEDLRRHLAMKVILGRGETPSDGGTPQVEPSQLARFLEEAQVTGQLDHPGIVPVHELGLDSEGRVFFTMKLVKGRDLKHVFDLVFEEKGGWNETRALGVVLRVCEALAYAHSKGVIHRDLKPANVMVGNFGEVYVMDWGLARVLGRKDVHDIRITQEFTIGLTSVKTERREEREELSDSPIATMEGDVVGTPSYMPPEQARGEIEKLSPRADVYAIGAMLYHLLARRAPYTQPGARISNRTVLGLVVHGPPAPLTSLRKDVPAELVAIVEKAMARDASVRYADTLALAEDLRAYLEHRVVGAYETGAWAEARKWVQRNKPLAASIATAALLLIAGLVTTLVFKSRATEQEELATQKANDVLSLSAIQELKELAERADELWPAFPEKLADYDRWLSDAKVLIDGRGTDPPHGIHAHPSLKDHEAKLAEIRKRAKPLRPEQVEADRKASPSFAQWAKARAQLTWMCRMLGTEPWPSEAEVEATLAQETLPADANGLNGMAWPLVDVDPAKVVYGSEVEALVLAKRAVAGAKDVERAGIRDTFAWALYRCGRLDASIAEEQRAMNEAQGKQKEELAASLKQLREEGALWATGNARSQRADEASKLAARVADSERVVNERRTYEFGDAQDRWWHTQLAQLIMDLRAFTDEESGGLYSSGTSERHGWGIVKRREQAATIEERSVSGADAGHRWDEAIAAIAKSPMYGGLKLTPQLGLLPIGEDPDSHLWEFAHVQTGELAQRGGDGKLISREAMGLVFVLIPGGTFWMGAQETDPSGHNYDPEARNDESPVHEVELSPYFLSKYEMTQGQWQTFTGRNPSNYGPSSNVNGHKHDLRHPVETVSWLECMTVMTRLALSLPSEAQWENGCRGGTATAWCTGAERESLRGKVNIADQSFVRAGGTRSFADDWPDLDDGWAVHAPAGTFVPNAFGLHEVHGNLWEWCLDGYDSSFYANSSKVDPVAPWSRASTRVDRGGGFRNVASDARSASRGSVTPEFRFSSLGVRPARALRLPTSRPHNEGK